MTDANAGSRDQSDQAAESFRWQAYFQRSSEPLFFLSRRRRLLFANRAWEALTGLSSAEMRGQVCKRRRLRPEDEPAEIIRALLAPPAEVLEGTSARVRRLVPTAAGKEAKAGMPRWWDILFFPFSADAALLGILGKISPVAAEGLFAAQPLPEKLIVLRQRFAEEFSLENLIAEAPAMKRVRAQVRLASRLSVPVTLVGEAGTGKRWLARCIHGLSKRREGTCAIVHCQRLPQQVLAEALFGEGGLTRRSGPATIYLHEPGYLPREMQDRLVTALVAAEGEEEAGPALLAGFAGDLANEVSAGRLIPELHGRLSMLIIPVPPLRERPEDVHALVDKLLSRAATACESEITGLTDEAYQIVHGHRWPGNIAELYQVLLDACARAKGQRIEAGDLPFYLRSAPLPHAKPLPLDALLEQVEKRLLMLALRHTRNNKTEAAELLAIWRQRLIRRMEALGIQESP